MTTLLMIIVKAVKLEENTTVTILAVALGVTLDIVIFKMLGLI